METYWKLVEIVRGAIAAHKKKVEQAIREGEPPPELAGMITEAIMEEFEL